MSGFANIQNQSGRRISAISARQSGLAQLLPLRPSQASSCLAPRRACTFPKSHGHWSTTESFAQPRPWLRRILNDPRRGGHLHLLLLILLNSPTLLWMRIAMREDTLNLVRQSFYNTCLRTFQTAHSSIYPSLNPPHSLSYI